MKNIVHVLTHPDKEEGANPRITPEGWKKATYLRRFLPEEPAGVVCGTGRRHLYTALAAGLAPTRYTATVGAPDSLDKMPNGGTVIVLADGTRMDAVPGLHTTVEDSIPSAIALVESLSPNSVIVGGRPFMIALDLAGFKNSKKSAAVFAIDRDEQGKIMGVLMVAECDGSVGAGNNEA